MLSKHQKFEVKTLKRSEINLANYNPRKISEATRKKLKANIKKVGLIETLVVNKTTMNLLSGHQRITIMDELEEGNDYDITVALVEMSLEEEKAQNVIMNNLSLQGEYDFDKLDKLFKEGLDWMECGFDEIDMAIFDVETKPVLSEKAAVTTQEKNDKIEEVKRARKESKDKKQAEETADFYICLYFPDVESKYAAMEKYGLTYRDFTYMNFDAFERVIAAYLKRNLESDVNSRKK